VLPKRRIPDVANQDGGQQVPSAMTVDAQLVRLHRGGSGGDYFLCRGGAWLHVVPTFDPNSADGYGPNQPLPPFCVRFPYQYTCPTDGPPPN
jgi:hypothetical protein